MKRGLMITLLILSSMTLVVAENCDLSVSLLNQDPYPAVPGDYVKLVFQIDGVENSECGDITFELLEKYPISFDPNEKRVYEIKSGTFVKDHSSFLMVPYKVRVDENALNGDNPVEVQYEYNGKTYAVQTKQFDINVEDVRADFEVTIKDYDPITNVLTFEILNTGESDVYALTLELEDQNSVDVKGSYRNIVGDLDSKDYTTADFEATPSNGEIKLKIIYTDSINVRRALEKSITFNSKYFEDRNDGNGGTSGWTYLILLVVIVAVVWWWLRRRKRKKHQKAHKH